MAKKKDENRIIKCIHCGEEQIAGVLGHKLTHKQEKIFFWSCIGVFIISLILLISAILWMFLR